MIKLGYLEDINSRKMADTYVYVLNEILKSGEWPKGVLDFKRLVDPKVEKETKNFIWISYQSGDKRTKRIFRNAYDIKF